LKERKVLRSQKEAEEKRDEKIMWYEKPSITKCNIPCNVARYRAEVVTLPFVSKHERIE
jgi:hypothetical protein